MLNVLTDPVFRIREEREERHTGLADILALYGEDVPFDVTAARSFHQHPWHAFVCQLAAMAMSRAGLTRMPTDATDWVDLLMGITPDHARATAWELISDDLTETAFLQPPASSRDRLREYRIKCSTPDEADILQSGSNHRVKLRVAFDNEPDDWILTLINVQTAAGVDAPRTYGIFRMNKGLGNRACVSLTPANQPGRAVRRDVEAIIETAAHNPGMLPEDDSLETILWTIPWDGETEDALDLSRLHPLCIEVARRIRLVQHDNGSITSMRATSRTRRVRDTDERGYVPEPWCPMNREKKTAYTPGDYGVTTRNLIDFLTKPDTWELPPLLQPTRAELEKGEPLSIITRNLTRGQGKTRGYHESLTWVGPETVSRLLTNPRDPTAVEKLEAIFKSSETVRRRITEALMQAQSPGNAEPRDYRHQAARDLANPWSNVFNERIHPTIFDQLERELAAPEEEREQVRREWLNETVAPEARRTLRQGIQNIPPPGRYREQARLRAEATLERCLNDFAPPAADESGGCAG